jgi:hypothetical protein
VGVYLTEKEKTNNSSYFNFRLRFENYSFIKKEKKMSDVSIKEDILKSIKKITN